MAEAKKEKLVDESLLVCPECGEMWAEIKAGSYYVHYACACGYRAKQMHGKSERGFVDKSVEHHGPYVTRLTVMAYLEQMGEATVRDIAARSGLGVSQVTGTIRRMLKVKGSKCIEAGDWVELFPSGKARRYRLTEYGRRYLEAARRHGWFGGVQDGNEEEAQRQAAKQ